MGQSFSQYKTDKTSHKTNQPSSPEGNFLVTKFNETTTSKLIPEKIFKLWSTS